MSEDELSSANSLYEYKTVAATSVECVANTELDGKSGVHCEDVDIDAVMANASQGRGVRKWEIDPVWQNSYGS